MFLDSLCTTLVTLGSYRQGKWSSKDPLTIHLIYILYLLPGSWFVAVRFLTCFALAGFVIAGIAFILRLLHRNIGIREDVTQVIHHVIALLTSRFDTIFSAKNSYNLNHRAFRR